ncbi:MAG: hypothetical protein WA112_11710 [Rugosibacter sp.]|jgi:hypothetical protein|nr:hypothetical protein [Rugosibacter sp.]
MQHLKFKTGFVLSLFVLLTAWQTSAKHETSSTLAGDAEAHSTAGSGDVSSVFIPEEVTAGASVAIP